MRKSSLHADCPVGLPENSKSILWLVAAGLSLYCLALTIWTGDIGFEGDDWWIFSWPYWNSFPASLLVYARESLRPIEGVYWIVLFEIFGFNKIVFHLFSLLLLAAASLVMGFCLLEAFPRRRTLVVTAVLFAFFLPTVSCLTYVLTTDNSRLCVLLFWVSVLAFQRWSARSGSWVGLLLPVLSYLLAFLTYEAASFLIFAVPLMVWPVHLRHPEILSHRKFLLKLSAGICAAFGLGVAIRFLFLSGGAVAQGDLLPAIKLLWSYPALLPFYLAAPFNTISTDPVAYVLGIAAMILASLLIFSSKVAERCGEVAERGQGISQQASEANRLVGWHERGSYLVVLGVAITILGMLPYQLAGYGNPIPTFTETVLVKWGIIQYGNTAWFNFNWSSRIYSAGSFGIAILLAALLTSWKTHRLQTTAKIVGVIAIGFMVVFHAGLRKDWQEAAEIRNELVASLINQVPDVKPNTNFVFLDLELFNKRAAVFRGWGGLRALVRMLYEDPKVGAWYLYPYSWTWPNQKFQQAIVSSAGFVTRGMSLDKPVPHKSLLLLRRVGSHLSLVNTISSYDGVAPTGISWKGVSALHSNVKRVLPWSETVMTHNRLTRNAWNTGLISTLHLSKVNLGFRILNRWYTSLRDGNMRRRLLSK